MNIQDAIEAVGVFPHDFDIKKLETLRDIIKTMPPRQARNYPLGRLADALSALLRVDVEVVEVNIARVACELGTNARPSGGFEPLVDDYVT